MTNATDTRNRFQLARLADCTDPDSSTSAGADFLRIIESTAIEAFNYADDEERADDCWIGDTSHEIADGAVPIYTHQVWETFADLAAWTEDPTEYGDDGSDMEQSAKVCLYMIAERLACAILEEMSESCECSDEYGPCERHGSTAAQREGAAVRTADDLLFVYCCDATDILQAETGEERLSPWGRSVIDTAAAALDDADSMGVRWLPTDAAGDAVKDDLSTLANQLESELGSLDVPHFTYWDDGYRIVKVSADCPLLEV